MTQTNSTYDIKSVLTILHKELLKGAGFKKNKALFTRDKDSVTQIIEFQIENSLDKFTINLGMYVKGYHELYTNGLRPPATITPAHCPLNIRIAKLIGSKLDVWWDLHDIEENTFNEINVLFVKKIIPFFEQYYSLNDVIKLLVNNEKFAFNEPLRQIAIAYLFHMIGDKSNALTHFCLARNEIDVQHAKTFFDDRLTQLGYKVK